MNNIDDRRRKWVDELQSGKYQQCFGAMTEDGCYCALGVGLVAGANSIIDEHDMDHNKAYVAIEKYYGLDHTEVNDIWKMNDRQKLSLANIGEILKQDWEL